MNASPKRRRGSCCFCNGRGTYDRWSYEILGSGDFIEPDGHNPVGLDQNFDVAPAGAPYWADGGLVEYLGGVMLDDRWGRKLEVGTPVPSTWKAWWADGRYIVPWVERAACSCTAIPSDYDRRKAERAEREAEQAEMFADQATRLMTESVEMLPDYGQPILVGHHSEARHRSLLKKSNAKMGRAIQAQKDADRLANKSRNTSAGGEISSDDPNAPAKLRARAFQLSVRREHAKATNRIARSEGQSAPFEAFELKNLGASIRRLRKRADQLEAKRSAKAQEPVAVGPYAVTWCVESNRVRVEGPRPSSKERRDDVRDVMRSAGFKFSRKAGAWQRHASEYAWSEAIRVAEGLVE